MRIMTHRQDGSWICPGVRLRSCALLIAFCLLTVVRGNAGAWNQQRGHGELILTASWYRSEKQFDADGISWAMPDYRQFITEASLEVGVSRRDSILLHVPGEFLVNQNGHQEGTSLGDVEVSWKHSLLPLKSRWALSGQVLLKEPPYSETQSPAPGNHQADVEGRVLLGRGHELGRQHFFWDLEAAYRYRDGAPADQFRGDGTVGLEMHHGRYMLLGQVFNIVSMQNGQALATISNPNAQSDFDLYKVQPSFVVRVFERTHLQAAWNDAYAGRNTGQGQTWSFSIWQRF